MSEEPTQRHRISECCVGVWCRICRKPATHKVGEELFEDVDFAEITFDDGTKIRAPKRHPFTAYLCCPCFRQVMGPAVFCPEERAVPASPSGASRPTIYPEGMIREDLDE